MDEYNIHHYSIILHDLVTICTDFSAFITAAAITMCSSYYIGNLNLGGENPSVPQVVLSFRVLCIYHSVSDFPLFWCSIRKTIVPYHSTSVKYS